MSIKSNQKAIFEMMQQDALEPEVKKRYFKVTDGQLLGLLNTMGEYFLPKEVRTNTDESRSNEGVIQIEYVKGKSTF